MRSAAGTRGFYGWKLLAALWLIIAINLAFPMYGLSVLDPYMAADLGFDRTTLGLAYAVFMVMTGFPSLLAAWLVHRVGTRSTLLLGNAILVLSAATMALAVSTPIGLVLVAGVAVGTANAIGGPVAAQASVTRWFVRRRSFALAIVLSGASIGGLVAAPVLDQVVRHSAGGWRSGWWLICALAVVACGVAWRFVKEYPRDLGQQPDGGPAAAAPFPSAQVRRVHITTQEWTVREAVRSPALWLLMLAATGFSACLTLFLAQGVVHFEDLGHSATDAALALSVSVISGFVANLAVGALGDRIDPRHLWSASLAVNAVGALLLIVARSTAMMYASAAVVGIGGSACMVCMITLLGNFYGPRAFPTVYAIASSIQSAVGALAPVLAGYWYDQHRTYTPAFLTVAAMCAGGAVLLYFIAPPRRPGLAVSVLPEVMPGG